MDGRGRWLDAADLSHRHGPEAPHSPPTAPADGVVEQTAAAPDISRDDLPSPGRTRPPEARIPTPRAELKPLTERRTVLVVDDDAIMLEMLVRILQRENYELLKAPGGVEALAVGERHSGPIDLLVTDYVMPEMQGRQVAGTFRERYADVKVLYQTGFSDLLFGARDELEDGAAFLEKPFTARGLRESARLVLFGAINP